VAGGAQQMFEQAELNGGEFHHAAVAAHRVRAEVHLQIADAEPARLFALDLMGAAQDSANARDELARVKRFGQVIVGPDLQADDAVHFVAARGEDEHRHLRMLAQAAQHVEPIHAG
jgi:hypothetical protein